MNSRYYNTDKVDINGYTTDVHQVEIKIRFELEQVFCSCPYFCDRVKEKYNLPGDIIAAYSDCPCVKNKKFVMFLSNEDRKLLWNSTGGI